VSFSDARILVILAAQFSHQTGFKRGAEIAATPLVVFSGYRQSYQLAGSIFFHQVQASIAVGSQYMQ
jgi:hypothetical protein